MCLLIVEVLMFITGAWALISGKLPSGLFKLLFGKGEYKADPRLARLVGLLLIFPISFTLLGGFILGKLFGNQGVQYAINLELILVVAVSILAVVVARKIKLKPTDETVR